MVGLTEIILDIVVLGRDAELHELFLERSTLFKETMYFPVNFHIFPYKPFCSLG